MGLKWMEMDGNGWRQMERPEMAGYSWKWLKITRTGWNRLKKKPSNCWKYAGNNWKWLELAGNGYNWKEWLEMAGNRFFQNKNYAGESLFSLCYSVCILTFYCNTPNKSLCQRDYPKSYSYILIQKVWNLEPWKLRNPNTRKLWNSETRKLGN